MTINQFKEEFRVTNTDTWSNALDAWFECAGRMNKRGLQIPEEWEYNPGLSGDGTEKESYWYYLFARSSNKQLLEIGKLLFRYCRYLQHKGVAY